MRTIRKIEVDSVRDPLTFAQWQALYLDQSTGNLFPSSEYWMNGQLAMQVNSLGCKGPEIDSKLPTVGIFGDSGVFCGPISWVDTVSVPGYQTLNAGVEGHTMARVVENFERLNKLVNVEVAVVYTGWHNLVYGDRTPSYWRSMLDRIRGKRLTAFCSLLTCLTEECRANGLDEFLYMDIPTRQARNLDEFFFWGEMAPTVDNINMILDAHMEYHAFLKGYCQENGAVLLDLNRIARPIYKNISQDFMDVCHPRRETYPKISKYVEQSICKALGQAPKKEETFFSRLFSRTQKDSATNPEPVSTPQELKDPSRDTQNIYPLW